MEEPKAMLLLIQEFVLAWKQQTNGWTVKAKKLHIFAKAWACCIEQMLHFVFPHCQTEAQLTCSRCEHTSSFDLGQVEIAVQSCSLSVTSWGSALGAFGAIQFSVGTPHPNPWPGLWVWVLQVLIDTPGPGSSRKMPLKRVICKWG